MRLIITYRLLLLLLTRSCRFSRRRCDSFDCSAIIIIICRSCGDIAIVIHHRVEVEVEAAFSLLVLTLLQINGLALVHVVGVGV